MKKFTPVIGMEVHVELKTKSKMFCGCPTRHFQVKPNTHTCPVCLGLPGALPVPNKKAVVWTGLIGLALNCTVNQQSKFDRKHYFYPDLPKGYQISQYDEPLCQNGQLILDNGKKIRITRVHIEEDTGKLLHKTIKGKKVTLVDFNRSGVPLVEIVSEPDINSGTEAKEYLKKLRDIIRALKVSDCDMEKGTMRLEANISLTPSPSAYKVEVKNLNSFRFVEQAINFEINRQTKLLQQGKVPPQETRGYDAKSKKTFVQRTKEEAEDYRYFPEPDIPPLVFTDKDIQSWRRSLPQLPAAQIETLISSYQLSQHQAQLLTSQAKNLAYFRKNIALAKTYQLSAKKFANLVINKKIDISQSAADQLKFLTQKQAVSKALILKIIADNPEVVKKYQAGKTSVLGFLLGQIMQATEGKADPKLAKKLLLENL